MPFGLNAFFTCLKVKSSGPNKVFERNNLPVYLLCCWYCCRWEWGQGSPHHRITKLWRTVTDRGLLLLQRTTVICSLVLISIHTMLYTIHLFLLWIDDLFFLLSLFSSMKLHQIFTIWLYIFKWGAFFMFKNALNSKNGIQFKKSNWNKWMYRYLFWNQNTME